MQILNDQGRGPGAGYASILNNALSGLTKDLVDAVELRNKEKKFIRAGYTPTAARIMALTPDQSLSDAMIGFAGDTNTWKDSFKKPEPTQQVSTEQQVISQQPMQIQQRLAPLMETKLGSSAIQGLAAPINPLSTLAGLQSSVLRPELMESIARSGLQQQQAHMQQPVPMQPPSIQAQQQQVPELTAGQRYARSLQKKVDLIQAARLEQEIIKNKKKDQPYFTKLATEKNNNRINKSTIKQMIQLNDSGKLDDARYVKALEFFGLDDLNALLSPESQQYKKLYNRFLGSLKDTFGSRITNFDANLFMQGLPGLMNSREGRSRIFKDMMRAYEASDILYDAKRSIIAANNGSIPPDIDLQAQEIADKKLDAIWNNFASSIGQPQAMTEEIYDDISQINKSTLNKGDQVIDQETGVTLEWTGTSFRKA
jgi:hypothetical protein